MAKIEIDMRLAIFATLYKRQEKKTITNEVKEAIRKGEYTTKFDSYGKIVCKNYTKSYYKPEDQEAIDKFIKEQGFEKVTETIENHTIEFVPSEKGIKEFNKSQAEQENSQYRNIAKVASQLRNTIK